MEPTIGNARPKATFGQRLAAVLIDAVILSVVGALLRSMTSDVLAQIMGAFVGLAYYISFEGSEAGQTLGKKALGIRVVDLTTAQPIGYGRATARYFGRIVSAIPFLLGYFWMLWDDQKQTWHDKFAGSMVVRESDYPLPSTSA